MEALKVSNISKSYGRTQVLSNISFGISCGEVLSFLGPNGAGKSTCLKIITGILKPDTGSVFIEGKDMQSEPLTTKASIGYLAENNPLYPELYVYEYLNNIADIYKLKNKKERIMEVVESLQLKEVLQKKTGVLSKGFKQRVGLAQAILHNPSVLILDEPFSGLDPNQLSEIYELIKESGKNKAILFSSHSIHEASYLSNKTIIINQGKIVLNTEMKELGDSETLESIFKQLTQ